MIDFEKLRIFYHVAKEGSVKRAAQTLEKNPTSVWKHIMDLEHYFKTKLFLRRKKIGLELTELGKNLFKDVNNLIPSLERACTHYAQEEKPKDDLFIITTNGVVSIWLIQKLKPFLEYKQNLKIRISTTNSEVDFLNSKADIGILSKVNYSEGLTQQKLLTYHSKLFASQEYLDKYGIPKTFDDLKNHKLISFYPELPGYRGNVDWHLQENMPLHTLRESWLAVNSAVCQLEAARQGLGILAIPKETPLLQDAGLVEVLPNEVGPTFDVQFITRAADFQSRLIRECYEFLKL
ncbi:MAG: LysR family transcriptional regulator [Candidatus Paracaedimonas acanthamoebae]|uniref:LysR family transcriptional regulator n=1 Tax=Candidatus Paracaedimonas acanthamoebae TaxID=244581 RepID=A0A8J7TV51_9PROT|nr:LysR family transcriptional regulator [Candidatus Paracaedimonas acanthamoebae]